MLTLFNPETEKKLLDAAAKFVDKNTNFTDPTDPEFFSKLLCYPAAMWLLSAVTARQLVFFNFTR